MEMPLASLIEGACHVMPFKLVLLPGRDFSQKN